MTNRNPKLHTHRRHLGVSVLLFGTLAWTLFSAASPSRTSQPQSAPIDSAGQITRSVGVKDIKAHRGVLRWTRERGSPDTSDAPKVSFHNASACTFAVGLAVTDGKGKRAVCRTNVTVKGGVSIPPSRASTIPYRAMPWPPTGNA